MTEADFHILVAEDNDVSRAMMVNVLEKEGFRLTEARDGTEAIAHIDQGKFHLALVDINMSPKGGFELLQYLLVNGIRMPIVIITGDESSDMLVHAHSLGVSQILQKPVLPDRLVHTVRRVLSKEHGHGLALDIKKREMDQKDLMLRAIELALGNAVSGRGLAFGAVIANRQGDIISEGVSGSKTKLDPLAHAEIAAIRQAVERIGDFNLSEYTLYTSCEPTLLSKALILGVGISEVYYGLAIKDIEGLEESQEEMKKELLSDNPARVTYHQLCFEETVKAFSVNRNTDIKEH
jgi:CheY-like chemotaxis protein